MLTEQTLFFLFATIAFSLFATLRKRNRTICFSFLTNAVFFSLILPKVYFTNELGFEIFKSDYAVATSLEFNASVICICAFVLSINFVYLFSKNEIYRFQENNSYSESSIKSILYIFFPISILFIVLYILLSGTSIYELFKKPPTAAGEAVDLSYFVHKLAQIAKCCFYMSLILLLTRRKIGYREWIVISISFLLTAFVYMIAGQRSGLFIMIMQFLIVYSIRGDLKLGTMVKVGIVLFSLVAVVTVARLGDSLATEGLQNTIFGRYFFDVEKIAGVIYFAVGTDTYPYSPFHIMTEVSNSPGFQPEFHRFIGESIFNTRNGIPLSLLGEIIYFLGPVFIVPASIVYSIFVRSMEYRIYASSATYFRLLLIVVLGNVYYFSLNANTFDLLKRLTLDLSYLFLAFLVFHIVDIFRNSRGRSAGATALRA